MSGYQGFAKNPITGGVDFEAATTGYVGGKAANVVYVLGRRTIFAAITPFQDLATYLVGAQSGLNAVAVGTEYFAVSTSATDVAGSAGVSKVRIVSLNSAGVQQVTSVTLNGTTKVSIGTGYTAFQWMESSEFGTAAAMTAVGDIAIFSGAGAAAAESTTVEQIKAQGNRSLSGRYTIPTGRVGYLIDWTGSAPGSQAMDIRLRADVFADDRVRSAGIFHFQGIAYCASGTTLFNEGVHYLKCPAGVMVKVSTYPAATTGTPRCDASVNILLVDL